MTGEDDGSFVVVERCADRPVPGWAVLTVRCGMCGAACWLSAVTGAGTMALAREHGDAEIRCNQCMQQMIGQGLEVTIMPNPAAEREAAAAAVYEILRLAR